jgi:ABC-type phosphate transport system substrate-binding protein
MKTFVMTIAAAGAMAAAALGFAGAASAAGGADATINGLQSDGYTIQLNGSTTAPLTACTVTDVRRDGSSGGSLTAYVNVACPDGC